MLATMAVARPMAAEKGKPLSVKDIMELLQDSVPSPEIASEVTEDSISIRMSNELESEFSEVGSVRFRARLPYSGYPHSSVVPSGRSHTSMMYDLPPICSLRPLPRRSSPASYICFATS